METYSCPECLEDIEINDPWEALGQEFPCPKCATIIVMAHEESYDDESGEESIWFFLEKA